MNNPFFYMPTKVIVEKNAIKNHGIALSQLGKIALIVTGRNSSKTNGSLQDLVETLQDLNVSYYIYDNVEENPSLDTVEKITDFGKVNKVDFVIGLGGGSPIDAAKAASILINNCDAIIEDLFLSPMLKALPLVAIPTTAGTGTETTPYAILTDHKAKTKRGIAQRVFPVIAFLDANYLMKTSREVTINTGVDALSHLIEGYLSTNSNSFSDGLAEYGLKIFGNCIKEINAYNIDFSIRESLMVASCIAGMVISQAGTSLPHGMGYPLTYYKGIPHGKANGVLLKSYMNFCNDKRKITNILSLLGFKNLDELGNFLIEILGKPIELSDEELYSFASAMANNKAKLKNHPSEVTCNDILDIYRTSVMRL